MNTNVKLLLSFLGGASTGALISFVVLKKKLDKAEEELYSSIDFYENEINKRDEEYAEELDKMVIELDTDKKEEKRTYVDYVKKYNPTELVEERYHNAIDPTEGLDPDVDLEEVYNESPPEDPPESDFKYEEPYLITRREFDETMLELDKITLTYYESDDVLADEQEEIIPDIALVVGDNALNSFGSNPEDEDVIYVRNKRLASDYEVVRVNESYAESVLGIVEETRTRTKRGPVDG